MTLPVRSPLRGREVVTWCEDCFISSCFLVSLEIVLRDCWTSFVGKCRFTTNWIKYNSDDENTSLFSCYFLTEQMMKFSIVSLRD